MIRHARNYADKLTMQRIVKKFVMMVLSHAWHISDANTWKTVKIKSSDWAMHGFVDLHL